MSVLTETAAALVGGGKGILAADESIGTMSSRLEKAGVAPTEENRRAYREMLVMTPDLASGVSGIIFCDETLRQRLSDDRPFPQAVQSLGILPGIKVDTGAKPLPGAPGDTVTEGLDGLLPRLEEYVTLGARFAKWRAVITVDEMRPSVAAVRSNSHALARYASACHQAGLVPIVEPEVLMTGSHSMARCREVTAQVLRAVTDELRSFGVDFAATVLKPNMVLPGSSSGEQASPEAVAQATVEVLIEQMPADLAGVAFLSGGQNPREATANLAAMQSLPSPWPLTFSFGRALVDPALAAWRGEADLIEAGQQALSDRASANSAVLTGAAVG
ncbi:MULTISPECIES: class I fructose-bisphosphate aldolase [Streptomyces]|uniref:fructose-bisphosphate aldolase n=1 Tax=Streptomyces sp. 900129855 TaxID=3155129 RepID=A0ABV2ZZJ4_9ACTN